MPPLAPSVGAGVVGAVGIGSVGSAEAFDGDTVGELVTLDGTRPSIPRFSSAVADRTATGAVGAMALYAGESVGGVTRVLPAREIVRELAEEAEPLLRRRH